MKTAKINNKQKRHCKPCTFYWTHGIKDGKHNNWCPIHGTKCQKAYGICLQQKSRKLKQSEDDE